MALPDIKAKLLNFKTRFQDNWPQIKKRAMGTEGIVWGVSVFAVLFLVVITMQSCAPRKGNILYGMCSEFLQLQVPFPTTIQQTEIEMYRKGVRIYYTHYDAFGEYQLEMTECSFVQDPKEGVQLERVYYDNIKKITKKERARGKGSLYEVEQQYIDLFNKSLSPAAIVKNNPDFIIPDNAIVRYY